MHSNDRNSPLVLAILDGFGVMPPADDNAVWLARAPFIHALLNDTFTEAPTYSSRLRAHGIAVGLPSDADMGNSEVGHNVIGAGRVFDQGAKQVEDAIAHGTIWGDGWRELSSRSRPACTSSGSSQRRQRALAHPPPGRDVAPRCATAPRRSSCTCCSTAATSSTRRPSTT